jgi:hypothetical protein
VSLDFDASYRQTNMLTFRSFITQPNMYARGILFGKMKYELGDHAVVRCPETGLEVDIEFKVKGWVGGTYNAIGGYIKDTKSGKNLYELSGLWNAEMFIKDLSTGKKELLFDATSAKPHIPNARPLEEQAPRESQKLWDATNKAIKKGDHRGATDAKTAIEEEQRREAAERGEDVWQPKLFKAAPPGDEEQLDWIISAHIDSTAPPQKQIEQVLAIAPILPGQHYADFNSSKALPSQQGKELPSQATSQPSSANDLIDFGQNDSTSATPSQPTRSAQPSAGLQAPMMPTSGDKLVRADSYGNEEAFVDAES